MEVLLRAVELREEQLQAGVGNRELLSLAHESYARGLLATKRTSEALNYLELALRVHQEDWGRGTQRTRSILRHKFQALVELGSFSEADVTYQSVLEIDRDMKNWARYVDDAIWFAGIYRDRGQLAAAVVVLEFGHDIATGYGTPEEVERIDLANARLEFD